MYPLCTRPLLRGRVHRASIGHRMDRSRLSVSCCKEKGSDGVGSQSSRESVSDAVNENLYSELRQRGGVSGDEGAESVLPNSKLSPQDVITIVLKAMKFSPKVGSRITLRFMSGQCEHAQMTPQAYENMLREGGQTAVLLGNFRSFSFPTPTFEQTVRLLSPACMPPVDSQALELVPLCGLPALLSYHFSNDVCLKHALGEPEFNARAFR